MCKLIRPWLAALLITHFLAIGNAYAEDYPNHLTILNGIWADTNLPDLPKKLVTGELDFEDSYFVGLAYSRTLVKDFSIPLPFTGSSAKGWDLEAEGSLVKHYHLQDHLESNLALVLRTREFVPFSWLGWTFAAGFGGSYAFEQPNFEKGPDGIRGEDTEQFQSHMLLEWDLFQPRFSRLHFIARVHHRSGIYGVISPQKTGSNFLAAGIRIDF